MHISGRTMSVVVMNPDSTIKGPGDSTIAILDPTGSKKSVPQWMMVLLIVLSVAVVTTTVAMTVVLIRDSYSCNTGQRPGDLRSYDTGKCD